MTTQFDEADVKEFRPGLDDESASATLDTMDGSLSFGPVGISYDVNIAAKTVSVAVTVLGQKIVSTSLSPSRLKIPINTNVGLAKVEGSLAADFNQTLVRYDIKGCVRKLTGGWACKKYAGVLVNW